MISQSFFGSAQALLDKESLENMTAGEQIYSQHLFHGSFSAFTENFIQIHF